MAVSSACRPDYWFAAILFVRDTHRMRAAVLASWPIWTLGLLAVSSAIWSVDPQMTLRRSSALVGTTLLGVYFGSTVSNEVLRRGLRIAIWIVIIGSGALILTAPDLGIHYDLHDGYGVAHFFTRITWESSPAWLSFASWWTAWLARSSQSHR